MHIVTCCVFKKLVSRANSSRPHNLFIDERNWCDDFLDYASRIISTNTAVVVTIDLLSSLCVITVYRIVLRASCAVCFMHHYYFILIVCTPGAEQIPYICIINLGARKLSPGNLAEAICGTGLRRWI